MSEEGVVVDDYKQSVFDARKGYNLTLEAHWKSIADHSLTQNLSGWVNALQSYYTLTHPFIRTEARVLVKNLLDKSDNMVDSYRKIDKSQKHFFHREAIKIIREANNLLYSATSHLMLPSERVDTGDFVWEEFMKKCDL